MLKNLDEEIRFLEPSPTKVLSLANFTDSVISNEFMNKVNQAGKEIGNYKLGKTALLGMIGIKLVLLQAFLRFTGNKDTKTFDTEDAAINWLTE